MSENKDRRETNPRMASSTGDPPIRKKKEDCLSRARFAEALAELPFTSTRNPSRLLQNCF